MVTKRTRCKDHVTSTLMFIQYIVHFWLSAQSRIWAEMREIRSNQFLQTSGSVPYTLFLYIDGLPLNLMDFLSRAFLDADGRIPYNSSWMVKQRQFCPLKNIRLMTSYNASIFDFTSIKAEKTYKLLRKQIKKKAVK